MKKFDELLAIADKLLGPQGCPWDKQQTLATLRPYLLEEVHELLEAIDLDNNQKITEELGDCFYTLIFIAKLGELSQICNLDRVLQLIAEKIIRRHPHIFQNVPVESAEEVIRNWDEVKKKEGKKNPIENIPPSLPALARAQKVISKIRRHAQKTEKPTAPALSEKELGQRLWELTGIAQSLAIDAESALRAFCIEQEKQWTQQQEVLSQ